MAKPVASPPKPISQQEAEARLPEPPQGGNGLKNSAYLIILLWGLNAGSPFLIPVCVAGLLAFVMAPLQRILHKKLRLPEILSIALSAIVLVSPLVLIGFLLVKQGQGLVEDFPHLLQSAQEHLTRFQSTTLGRRLGMREGFDLGDLFARITSSAGQGVALIVGGLSALLSAGSQAALVLLFSIVMLASRTHLRRSCERILAQNRSLKAPKLMDDVVSLIEHFLIARLLIVGIIGAFAAAILTVFGLDYSVFLGAIVGAFTLIPAVGFILSLIPTIAVAIATGHSLGSIAGMLGGLLVANLIDNNVLTPKLVGGRLNINALSSFIGLFAGGLLWGVWGMFLSIPILGVLRIAFSAIPSLHPWGELLAESQEKPKPPLRERLPLPHRRSEPSGRPQKRSGPPFGSNSAS